MSPLAFLIIGYRMDPTSLHKLDYEPTTTRARWRTTLAGSLAVVTGSAAGYFLAKQETVLGVTWLYLCFLGPVILCWLAVTRHLPIALVFSGLMMAFPLLGSVFPTRGSFLGSNPEQQINALVVNGALTSISLATAASIAVSMSPTGKNKMGHS
jgi:hypothetical protein